MVKKLYDDVTFSHLVLFQREEAIFSVGRTNDGHVRIFLAFGNGNGRVYSRNGAEDTWEEMDPSTASHIKNRIQQAHADEKIPKYNIGNGSPVTLP